MSEMDIIYATVIQLLINVVIFNLSRCCFELNGAY